MEAELAQGILLDDPSFIRELLERVIQQILEAGMSKHIGADPYERTTERNGHKPRALGTRAEVHGASLHQKVTEINSGEPKDVIKLSNASHVEVVD
jgi:hypothetical protein